LLGGRVVAEGAGHVGVGSEGGGAAGDLPEVARLGFGGGAVGRGLLGLRVVLGGIDEALRRVGRLSGEVGLEGEVFVGRLRVAVGRRERRVIAGGGVGDGRVLGGLSLRR